MSNKPLIAGVLAAVLSGFPGASARADDAAARGLESFQQGLYEFGVSLVLGDGSTVREEMSDMWARLARLRDAACPKSLRKEVADITQAFAVGKDAASHLDDIAKELDKLAATLNVTEARSRLARAREALAAKNQTALRSECVGVMDAVVEQIVKFPLTEWVDGLRKATGHLAKDTSEQQRREAGKVLRTLPGFEKFRDRAFRESLAAADAVIAAGADLYVEGQNTAAREQLDRIAKPLALAARAAPDEAARMRVGLIPQQIKEADRLIVREPNNYWSRASTDGFRLLRKTREDIGRMLEGAPASGSSGSSGKE